MLNKNLSCEKKNLSCVWRSKETEIGRDFPCTKRLHQNVNQIGAWVLSVWGTLGLEHDYTGCIAEINMGR